MEEANVNVEGKDIRGREALDKETPIATAPARRFTLLPSIYGALVLAFFTVVLWNLLSELGWLLMLLYLAILLACGISAPVRRLESWRVPRAAAILIVFFAIVAIAVGLIVYAVPPFFGQVGNYVDNSPTYIDRLKDLQARWTEWEGQYPELISLREQGRELVGGIGQWTTDLVLELPGVIATSIFGLFSVLTFAFLFLMTWERLRALILSLIHPRYRELTISVLDDMGGRLGAYLRAKVIVMTVVGVWVYITLVLLDSPYPLLATIVAALMEAIPRIGPWIGRVAIVLATVPIGWEAVAIAVVSHVIIENIKGYWLSPLVEGHQVDIHPLTAFISVIAGGILFGWIGALVAVPTAAAIQVLFEQVLIPWRHRQLAPAEAEWAKRHSGDDTPSPSR
jgi:predicted PurR-regulated permease PerM